MNADRLLEIQPDQLVYHWTFIGTNTEGQF
jgi:hypothetical protein